MNTLDRQVGGDHYKTMDIQPWEAIRAWLTPDQFEGYMIGTAIAYLGRINANRPGKGGLTDVGKAVHTLEHLLETSAEDAEDCQNHGELNAEAEEPAPWGATVPGPGPKPELGQFRTSIDVWDEPVEQIEAFKVALANLVEVYFGDNEAVKQ